MIKIRLMGTEEEIRWMEDQIGSMPQVRILDSSEVLHLYGTKRYFRKYLQAEERRPAAKEAKVKA